MSVIFFHLYLFNIAVSWGLLTLIWLVQIIIYPGLLRIPSKEFVNYHTWYTIRITAIVFPLMIGEVMITVGWLILDKVTVFSAVAAFFVVFIWLSTFTLQVPIHKKLQSGKDKTLIKRLVKTNWIRTFAWSMKTVAVTIAAGKYLW
jgi:hypothetical protein